MSNTGFSDQEFDSWQRSLKDAGRPQVRLAADHGSSGAAAGAAHSPRCACYAAAAATSQDKPDGMRPNIPPLTLADVPSAPFFARLQVSRRVARDVLERLTKAAQYTYTGG